MEGKQTKDQRRNRSSQVQKSDCCKLLLSSVMVLCQYPGTFQAPYPMSIDDAGDFASACEKPDALNGSVQFEVAVAHKDRKMKDNALTHDILVVDEPVLEMLMYYNLRDVLDPLNRQATLDDPEFKKTCAVVALTLSIYFLGNNRPCIVRPRNIEYRARLQMCEGEPGVKQLRLVARDFEKYVTTSDTFPFLHSAYKCLPSSEFKFPGKDPAWVANMLDSIPPTLRQKERVLPSWEQLNVLTRPVTAAVALPPPGLQDIPGPSGLQLMMPDDTQEDPDFESADQNRLSYETSYLENDLQYPSFDSGSHPSDENPPALDAVSGSSDDPTRRKRSASPSFAPAPYDAKVAKSEPSSAAALEPEATSVDVPIIDPFLADSLEAAWQALLQSQYLHT